MRDRKKRFVQWVRPKRLLPTSISIRHVIHGSRMIDTNFFTVPAAVINARALNFTVEFQQGNS